MWRSLIENCRHISLAIVQDGRWAGTNRLRAPNSRIRRAPRDLPEEPEVTEAAPVAQAGREGLSCTAPCFEAGRRALAADSSATTIVRIGCVWACRRRRERGEQFCAHQRRATASKEGIVSSGLASAAVGIRPALVWRSSSSSRRFQPTMMRSFELSRISATECRPRVKRGRMGQQGADYSPYGRWKAPCKMMIPKRAVFLSHHKFFCYGGAGGQYSPC